MFADAGELNLSMAPMVERQEPPEEAKLAEGCFLSELPGIAIGIVTLGWILASFAAVVI